MVGRAVVVATTSVLLVAAVGCEGQPEMEPDATQEAAGEPAKEVLVSAGQAPYSPVVRSGHLLFLSGVIGVDRDAEEQGAPAETRRVLERIRNTLQEVDASLEDVVKCTVFLVDMDDYGDMNDVYSEFFPSAPPARSTVAVDALPAGAEVEVECIAAAS